MSGPENTGEGMPGGGGLRAKTPKPGATLADNLTNPVRADWIRLRTLIVLRWLAVAGQTLAVLVAEGWLGLTLPLVPVMAAILASAAFNLITMLRNPPTRRLREGTALIALLFDLAQLAFLLYLTGGLGNPFCFLLLAPITISATALSLRSALGMGTVTGLCVIALTVFHIPLTTNVGAEIAPPPILLVGTAVSLLVGCAFIGAYARRVTTEIYMMSEGLNATRMALEREQKLTDIGGIVAAAAHELGTPLATIKLASGELAEELAERPDLLEDVGLIRSQADRCRDILNNMGRMGRDDAHLQVAPVSAVVQEAAAPHMERGRKIEITAKEQPVLQVPDQPQIARQPEVIHGLRNLVQNAVDFARNNVWIDVDWNEESLEVTIEDDGQGFAIDTLMRFGDPFLREGQRRGRRRKQRPEYEGMGLGLFIAKTLLERSGAQLRVENVQSDLGRRGGTAEILGARVLVTWPIDVLEVPETVARRPLGQNRLNYT